MTDSSSELKEIRQKLEEHALQLNYAQKLQDAMDDIRALKSDVAQKWGYFKTVATVASLILTIGGIIAGMIGFRTIDDAKRILNDNIAEQNEFYGDVIASSALFSQGQYGDVSPKLLKWFHKGHTYDKTILIPLLVSLNITDDWIQAKPVIAALRKDYQKFNDINDASVYATIGVIEVQFGITNLNSQNAGEAESEMEQGNALLESTYRMLTPVQSNLRRNILTNQWLYHIAKGEFEQSQQYVASLKTLPPETKVFSWEEMGTWSCMVAMAKRNHPDMMKRSEQQWSELKSRYFPLGHRQR